MSIPILYMNVRGIVQWEYWWAKVVTGVAEMGLT